MKKQVFKTPRRGWLGNTPLGFDYMEEVNERARRMKAAIRDALLEENSPQLSLPFRASHESDY